MAKDGGNKFARRDRLREIEAKVQQWWEQEQVFKSEPGEKPPEPGQKFFGTLPFPYMNGYLHLGHAFSLSKLEFAAAFHRLCGANVLLPFAFHCTGMPIQAAAGKLAREIQQFGNPPVFPDEVEEQSVGDENESGAPAKFKGKKSKVAAKSSGQAYQWEILRSVGISDAEIPEFRDPYKWLSYFPPLAMEDLKAFGLGCDWRRSFVTTDMNPYFDSFVRWQMRKLKSLGKVVKDVRYTIFSPLDGQPCGDHDRASGEGAQPQEYTIIKMELVSPFPKKFKVLEGKKVFLAAATLRPETMYGQTNAWVLPDGKYGAFEINETEIFVMTRRAALNLAYQNHSRVPQKPTCLLELTGHDLIGLPLKSPLSFNEIIYALPMLSILMDKGTGLVTSVPSDAPDDYMALHDLKSNPAFREKYGVKDEWVLPFEIVPIIDVPSFGNKSAETVCLQLEIKSQNEKDKLEKAKKETYLKGFNEGTMIVGEFSGKKVQEAKPLIRSKLLKTGQAIVYSEPEKRVMSRSGDECVVALTDQWYITYGESEWKKLADECLSNMSLYSEKTRHEFQHSLGWLNQWACSRSFGLGTRIPWDEQFLVESLSDSTIYMAYYTIAHYLQDGDMYGSSESSIKPQHLTDDVWDYIFCDGPLPKAIDISSSLLERMKLEFEYWYPFDLRVSGKDLISNHLTFCIYNHTAIMPKHHWPRGFRCNGHITLNSEKMSKSTGNFKTIRQAIEEFSADATRFSLADAGDGVDDANFVPETANQAILKLTKELAWYESILAAESSMRTGAPSTFADHVFANAINIAIKTTEQNYTNYMFREALKSGFNVLRTARDKYRSTYKDNIEDYNHDLVWRFMDVQTRLLAPICPHYAEFVWREILKKDGFVVKAGWPTVDAPDLTLKIANKYLQDSIARIRDSLPKKRNKKSAPVVTPAQIKGRCLVYVNEQYDGWKAECLGILQNSFNIDTRTFPPKSEIKEALQQIFIGKSLEFKQIQELCMPFLDTKMKEAIALGAQALDLRLPFGEVEFLRENSDLIMSRVSSKDVVVEDLDIVFAADADSVAKAGSLVTKLNQYPPSPGNPTSIFLPK
ncbi:leucine--tRNA ligase, cytoplasmic-like [Vicia villosa]|uniref:leucine--tRNA ligase, cytoplasmic-like n=1 Tax=Vicia villosa TaxID=3911 RepID=UPI00273C1C9A|nr:leucine--tRNA ligase, cytoplasmic-like [Vicia villosa]